MTSPRHIGEANITPARGVGRKPQLSVPVLDTCRRPLDPTTPAHARRLLHQNKAAVLRCQPFTLILKREIDTPTQNYRLGIDPGAKTTGMAVVRSDGVVVTAIHLSHRGERVRQSLAERRQLRRARRSRKLRHRQPRFLNRARPRGWLPPSLESRVANVATWARRLTQLFAISELRVEDVRFDTQFLQNPEISGVDYQRGELWGWEMREYLLCKWGHACAYCGVRDVPLTVDHVVPRARGGSDRVSNLVIAREPCNQVKGAQPLESFLAKDLERLHAIKAQLRSSLRDTAAVNSSRRAIRRQLEALLATPLSGSTGGRTRYNRHRLGLAKAHWIDAACVGEVEAIALGTRSVLSIEARGHGHRRMCISDRYGFPRGHRSGCKYFFGFRSGDLVEVTVPRGKHRGKHRGVVTIRASGSFGLLSATERRDGISHQHFQRLAFTDGYKYSLSSSRLKEGASSEQIR